MPALWETLPAAPGFWAMGSCNKVIGRGLAASLRAQGKAPTMKVVSIPPAKIEEELVRQL